MRQLRLRRESLDGRFVPERVSHQFSRQVLAKRGSEKRALARGPPRMTRGPPHSARGGAVRRWATIGTRAGASAGTGRAQPAPSANHCQPESLLGEPVSMTPRGLPTLPRRTFAIVSPAAHAQAPTAKQAVVQTSASTMRRLSSISESRPHEGLTNENLGETSSAKTETVTTPTRRANPVAANAEVRGLNAKESLQPSDTSLAREPQSYQNQGRLQPDDDTLLNRPRGALRRSWARSGGIWLA